MGLNLRLDKSKIVDPKPVYESEPLDMKTVKGIIKLYVNDKIIGSVAAYELSKRTQDIIYENSNKTSS